HQVGRVLKIAAHAAPKVLGLADIEHRPPRILEQINTRVLWQMSDLVEQVLNAPFAAFDRLNGWLTVFVHCQRNVGYRRGRICRIVGHARDYSPSPGGDYNGQSLGTVFYAVC